MFNWVQFECKNKEKAKRNQVQVMIKIDFGKQKIYIRWRKDVETKKVF